MLFSHVARASSSSAQAYKLWCSVNMSEHWLLPQNGATYFDFGLTIRPTDTRWSELSLAEKPSWRFCGSWRSSPSWRRKMSSTSTTTSLNWRLSTRTASAPTERSSNWSSETLIWGICWWCCCCCCCCCCCWCWCCCRGRRWASCLRSEKSILGVWSTNPEIRSRPLKVLEQKPTF